MDFIKCYAYNKDGHRCMQAAGHTANHAFVIEWTDEECWQPGTPIAAVASPAPAQPSSGVCVICDHPIHRGPCKAKDGEFGCDCAEGVE